MCIRDSTCTAYKIDRPSRTIEGIEERDENLTATDEAAVGIGVEIHSYREDSTDPPYNGNDGLMIRAIATANTRKAISYDYYTISYITLLG